MRLFLAALVLLLALPVHAAEPVPTEPVKLAVMYFENSGNDELEMLKVGLAQMLITDLSGEKRFDVVERTRLNELLAEQELQKTDKVDADTAVNLGRIIGARYMVLGAYFEVMGQLRVDARIVDVATSRIVSVGSRMPADNLWDLHDELVGAIADAIADAEIRRNAWDAAHPPKPRMRMRAPAMNDDSDRDAGSMGESFDDSVDESANFGEEVAEEIVEAPVRSTAGRGGGGGGGGKKKGGGKAATAEAKPAPEPSAEPTPAAPKDPMGAAIAFSEGLDFLDRKDVSRARKRFERALELDPSLEDAKSELASLSI